jgi:flagellin
MSVINTNVLSLVTQNNLKSSEASLNSAIQRLSSGMRINSAKDDAAGQAIANRFTANIRGLTQAQRNANDGISLAQTTEGALNQVNDNLQRIRELSVQAANGSNSTSDLKSIQDEINQRLSEIDRTSAQTDFNGVKVLSSSAKSLSVQVGANDGERINIDLQEISSKTLNLTGFNVDGTGTANTAASENEIKTNGYVYQSTSAAGVKDYLNRVVNGAGTSAEVFNELADTNTVTTAAPVTTALGTAATGNVFTYHSGSGSFTFDTTGVAQATVASQLTPAAGGSLSANVSITGAGKTQAVKIDSNGAITAADDNSVLYLDSAGNLSKTNGGAGTAAATLTNLLASMSTGASSTGGSIAISTANGAETFSVAANAGAAAWAVGNATIGKSNLLTLANVSGYATNTNLTVANAAGSNAVTYTATVGGVTANQAVKLDTAGKLTSQVNTDTHLYVQTNGAVTDGAGSVEYNDSANPGKFTTNTRSGVTATANPLAAVDAALSKVDNLRSSLGAVQNRFDSVIANLGTTVTNLTASRSRIQDADYATEVSNMSRAQILQQAGTSVLAQANQSTQGVLSLLR